MTRPGFTLVELLLVLALIVVAGAIASVGLSSGDERARLEQAAERLGIAWSEARLRAIESGAPLVFRCRIGDRWGYVGASETPTNGAAADSAGAGAVEPAVEQVDVTLGDVDAPINFQQLSVAERPGAPPVGLGVREGDLSAMIVFYPDGATSDAEATIATENGRRMLVTLRGLTGGVRIAEPADDRPGAAR